MPDRTNDGTTVEQFRDIVQKCGNPITKVTGECMTTIAVVATAPPEPGRRSPRAWIESMTVSSRDASYILGTDGKP